MGTLDQKKAVLIVIDGWGVRAEKEWNAIAQAKTPNYDRFLAEYAHGVLEASGLPVGLPAGVMGNSEVGHMNIGAGRRVVQDQVRIHESIDDSSFFENKTLIDEIEKAAKSGKKLHLMGLVSKGNVHSAERHYLSLIDLVSRRRFPMNRLFIHAILDGRDTPPKSATEYLATLENKLKETGGKVATVSGRFFAMDRDKRWERIDAAYQAMVNGKGKNADAAKTSLNEAYARGETDEFVLPTVVAAEGVMEQGDSVICFNFRPDRMRQIVTVLERDAKLSPVTFTRYDKTFPFKAAFPPQEIDRCLGSIVADQKWKQYRTAETEKYAHVTYFFNGGREQPFEGEERLLIPSPKVKTYDLTPEMSSKEITAAVVNRIAKNDDGLIVLNFAHPDMVGHTGNWEASIVAVESTDRCLGEIAQAALDGDRRLFITSDHGNVEMMRDAKTGQAHTAHTVNPVPFIAIGEGMKKMKVRAGGALSDVAPTILSTMGAEAPSQMTGKNLLIR